MPVCDTPTTPKPNGCESPMVSDRKTYAHLMEQRHKEAHEREARAKAWAAEVTEQLANQQSSFLKDFNETEQRIFGLVK
jgi:ribosomal protein L9